MRRPSNRTPVPRGNLRDVGTAVGDAVRGCGYVAFWKQRCRSPGILLLLSPLMALRDGAPAWAADLSVAFESGASGQFILYGNVHDRLALGGQLVNVETYIEEELLAAFDVIFSYDLGN